MPPKKVLQPEAKRKKLRQKTYSFVVATAVLARLATVKRPLAKRVKSTISI